MSKKLNKILFITKRFVIEPLGIGYLSAGLKQKGFEVDLLQIDKDTDYIGCVNSYSEYNLLSDLDRRSEVFL